MTESGRFAGGVAVVTGAARGFGAAIARAFAAEGAAVALLDRDMAEARRTAAGMSGARALPVACDVADDESVEAAVATVVAELGDVSVLVNNAGLHRTRYNRPFGEQPRQDVRDVFDVNVMGVVNCTVACAPSMRRRGGGAVVNISSLAAYEPTTPYGVSKLAVRGLTIAFAAELGPAGIRVNAIAPGLMATDNAIADLPPELVDDFVRRRQSVRRLGGVDDVVSAVLHLCGPGTGFVTGETLRIDGGVFRGI